MEKSFIRLLKSNEIECRIATINEKGLSLLLYKDARVDQRILDETFGPFGWKRSHQCIDGNLYCTVEIFDQKSGEWISKQDVGSTGYTEKEKSHMYEIGAKDVIDKILPVVDNFERGLGAVKEEEKEDPFVQGMEMVYKQLMSTLEGIGVKPIEAAGQEFNPDFHNAVMHVDDDELGENIVVEELQKGYMYRDSVVRHSMVKVAN